MELLDCESVTTSVAILDEQSPAVGDCEHSCTANIHHILDILLQTSQVEVYGNCKLIHYTERLCHG